MKKLRLALIFLVLSLVSAFFILDLDQYLTFAQLKARQSDLQALFAAQPALFASIYFVAYVVMAALSLPGAAIMTLAGGAIFGLLYGTLLVSFASTLGATLALLTARFILRDSVQARFGDKLESINRGLEKEGGFYLFTLRLIPLFPFFVINLAMGLTRFSAGQFYWISQIGMLPGTLAYVNAGTQLAHLESPAGILSPKFLLSFAVLGIFPILAKRLIDALRARKVYRNFKKPKKFDYNLVVLGAGSGGLISAYIAAAVKARVALIEKSKMGGDCLNTGCVPSKTLLRSAHLAQDFRRSKEFGFSDSSFRVDFRAVMARVQNVIAEIAPNDSIERYSKLGVQCFQGVGQILSPYEVEVGGEILTTRNIVIATGAGPMMPNLPGIDRVQPLNSDNLWQLQELPRRLLVLGGGAIGCEMSQAFRRLGSEVTQVERHPRLMYFEEPEASQLMEKQFVEEGIRVLTSHSVVEFGADERGRFAICQTPSAKDVRLDFDQVLVAVGRKPHTQGFGLERLGIEVNDRGFIVVDEYLRTKYPNIYAVGDVTGPYLFTHAASHQAWHAAVNSLFGKFKKFKVDYSNLPWCTYTDPEVARVGLSEAEARERGIAHQVFHYDLGHLDRAIAEGENRGFIKLIIAQGKDKILGATVAGPRAGDLLAEIVLAKRHGLGLNAIMAATHSYPTFAEANKMAAGVWKKATAPQNLLGWLEKFHHWMRHA